jgi:protein-S-isoprenylcysteine O-methyltransferase Ste14
MDLDVHRTLRILWLAVFVVWAIARASVKQTVRSQLDLRVRGPVWVVWIAWALLFGDRFRPGPLGLRFLPITDETAYTGLAITAVGLAFAVWARFAIGRNWDDLVALKEDHQLVRGGPYAIVRHPIYSGFMLATLGTAVAQGDAGGLISTALIVIAWAYKARVEEAFMIEQFGAEYEQYRREVKGLIPLVW